MNENGQRLLELCTFHDLCITNSLHTKPQGFVETPTLKALASTGSNLGQAAAIKNVLHTRSYHSADCDTDHSLVCCKIRMQPKKLNHTKTKVISRIVSQQDVSTRPHRAVRSDL